MTDASTRRRGRPRSFDTESALDSVVEVFLRKGFGGTSLDELAAAAGLNRPNLAAAFGDKRTLYVAALEHYRSRMRDRMQTVPFGLGPLRAELEIYLDFIASLYAGGNAEQPLGCLVFATAPSASVEEPEVRQVLEDTIEELDERLERRFERAAQAGELPSNVEPAGLALAISSLVQSLALRARAGASERTLRKLHRRVLDALLPASRPRAEEERSLSERRSGVRARPR
ncbi:TetR/AcrR family transcriptional regulator [Pendulispora albinea]|uniref:TetR/AcrR family transcriptional regulator n=1 Tax=Pendulispora albinea TaxID=2741071 RepID=A0ABZ2LZI3_9BACT